MTKDAVTKAEAGPVLPRRAFVAAGLSAVVAGAAAWLASAGLATRPLTESFQFSRGTSFASGEETRLRGYVAAALTDDRMQVIIVGHTGEAGDAAANEDLSLARAEAAATIARSLGVPEAQITLAGLGGAAPLPKEDGEGNRAHQSRLARVDVTLQLRK